MSALYRVLEKVEVTTGKLRERKAAAGKDKTNLKEKEVVRVIVKTVLQTTYKIL